MMPRARFTQSLAAFVAATLVAAGMSPVHTQAPPVSQPPPSQREVFVPIMGDIGAPPRLAVTAFVALTPDSETRAVAEAITEVLTNDLQFEREFYLIPGDVVRTMPAPRSIDDAPYDRWREIGADGIVVGTVRKTDRGVLVQVRLLSVRTRESAFGKEYSGSTANPRLYAHTIADEIHQQQRRLRGVARTKIAFASDRDGERVPTSIADRQVKEIYIADYDGANQRRVTVTRVLNNFPVWSGDGRALAYTSWRQGFPNIIVQHLFSTMPPDMPAGGSFQQQNWLAAWSPDGSRIVFTSSRHGNAELYVMNADGSNLRRLTNHPGADTTPTWSPTGAQIAFVSDRTGSPSRTAIARRGRRRRSTRSPTRRARALDTTSRSTRSPRARYARSRSAKARTRVRRSRRTAGTSPSRRRVGAGHRLPWSGGMATTSGRLRAWATTSRRPGRSSELGWSP